MNLAGRNKSRLSQRLKVESRLLELQRSYWDWHVRLETQAGTDTHTHAYETGLLCLWGNMASGFKSER